MNLQEHLIKLSAYNIGCKFADGYLLVNITFDKDWTIIPPENEGIEYLQKGDIHYYCAPLSETAIDEVFGVINDTIEYNLDLIKKLEMFKECVEELRTLFANEDIVKLKTLRFVFDEVKKKKKTNNIKKKQIIKTDVQNANIEKTQVKDDVVNDTIQYNDYQGEEDNNIVKPMEELDK